jgi:ubiquinone/menaquinone biosynthesis C-methylase UbiE
MNERLTPEQIREYWSRQAATHGSSPSASWSDVWAIDLEIREIAKRLANGDHVLDVGCGNGYSAVQLAATAAVSIRGIDYVPAMIEQARARAAAVATRLAGQVQFAVGDLTALDEPINAYDKVIAVRVLINLGDWSTQRAALLACSRVVKPGGLLLLSEATLQGWEKLNAFREEWQLPRIPMPSFNTYLDEGRVVEALAPACDFAELVNFSSTYFVATRVLKPLLDQALGGRVDVAAPDVQWNRWWSQWPAYGDYGTQKLFVFRKR